MLALLMVVMAAPPTAGDSERERVATLLSAIHEVPARAALEKAAKDPQAIVLDLAADKHFAWRASALQALAWWPDARSLAVVRSCAERDAENMRHRCLRTLAQFGEAALEPLEAALQDENLQIRITAIVALGELGAQGRLRSELARQTSPEVKRQLRRALSTPAVR